MTYESNEQILIALGGNLISPIGLPQLTIPHAVDMLNNSGVQVTHLSSMYETCPVPASGQPDFVNMVVKAETNLSATKLLVLFKELERECGRKKGERWSARTLDIDLIAYGKSVLPNLESWHSVVNDSDPAAYLEEPVVPHPRMHKRGFVLIPLREIGPNWLHPVLNLTVEQMCESKEINEEERNIKRL